jgi:hypothetical protein
MRRVLLAVFLLAGSGACAEELTVPGHCPELCPGGQPQLRDTVIVALEGRDSTFSGYLSYSEVPSLLVSNGLPAGEARAWYLFPARSDSITVSVGDTARAYSIDSVKFSVNLVARDTTVKHLVLQLHRLPIGLDSLTSFDAFEALLTPESLIDTVAVPDSVVSGQVDAVLKGDLLDRVVIPPEDSGRIAIGYSIRASAPTGIRLGSSAGFTSSTFVTYARVDVTDTTLQRQTLTLAADTTGYVRNNGGPPSDPDLLYLGRVPAARAFLRFNIPSRIRDSATVVRATLELIPAEPMLGLKGDRTTLEVRGVTADIGAKSTAAFTTLAVATLPDSSDAVFSMDVIGILAAWRGTSPLPQTLTLRITPEGASFHQPVFHSTRSGQGARLRITYLVRTAVEQP